MQFQQAIRTAGLVPPEMIEADGKLRRFASNGKRGDDAGWYLLHGDGIPAGSFGDWRTGLVQTWRADIGRPLTQKEEADHRARIEVMQREREAARAKDQAEAAGKAARLWKQAAPVRDDHPYLLRKQVAPVATLREIDLPAAVSILGYSPKAKGEPLNGRLLVAPIKVGESVSTCELIDESGRKSAISGGAKAGGYWAAQPLASGDGDGLTLLLGEGVATVLSAKAATHHLGVAALSSGNLKAVAKTMRERYPAADVIILADLVKATGEADPHAIDAARSVGGKLVVPDFGPDRDPGMTDINDMATLCGLEAVRRAIANALPVVEGDAQPSREDAPGGELARSVSLIRASDVTPEPISWLWDGWLAVGKMHVLGGAPGTGKTTIAMGLAATVTTGGRWPDGSRCPVGNVVIWSGEDDPADTLIPRLCASGADPSRVYFIADVLEGGERRSFDPAKDMEPLRRKLMEIGDVRLLVVDPIVSAVAGDGHKNTDVRRGLQPLVDLAGSMRCALIGITHFSKGTGGRDPVERLTGSIAFGALARVVLVAAKHQEEGEDGKISRLFCRAKSNIGPDDGGFGYDLQQSELQSYPGVFASSVLWGDAVEGAARELLATADAAGEDSEGATMADVQRFLSDLLEGGAMRAGEVIKEADGAGYSKRSIQRAANKIGVERHKDGMRGGWHWRLPAKVPTCHEDAEGARTERLASTAPSVTSSQVEVEI